ncbi:GAF and ANTAR domain-containing protein [Nocardioides sp. InS609-2]|uniref:GAF and ANTAR domain-containing protein n=1 Tax=Nocardioides sp. InS609-2 TaxID=2760705 RepID=UPI0017E0B7AE|nr:GAF and ANTAR domain-containing protein [Nocardioides sp. InS609-2]MBA3782795.1 GAF and ANTAR domain-containing protein [Nocardioides sp.]
MSIASTDGPQRLDDWFASVPALALAHFGCDRAGVALRGADGAVITLAASDAVVGVIDWFQSQHADGPAVSPAWCAPQVAVSDLTQCRTWPVWASAIAELGVVSVLATQILTPEGSTGSLTLYYTRRVAFTDHELALARVLAQHAGSALGHARTAAHLMTAVGGRARIGQAQGILMERFGLAAEDAFAVMIRHSQDTNTTLQDIAECLIATHALDDCPTGEHP